MTITWLHSEINMDFRFCSPHHYITMHAGIRVLIYSHFTLYLIRKQQLVVSYQAYCAYVCFDSMIKFIIFITVWARFTFPDNTQFICILESMVYIAISAYALLQRPLSRKILNITILLVNLFYCNVCFMIRSDIY